MIDFTPDLSAPAHTWVESYRAKAREHRLRAAGLKDRSAQVRLLDAAELYEMTAAAIEREGDRPAPSH